MLPIAPLMIEHRLIEKMIAVIRKEIDLFESGGNINPEFEFIDAAVDFISTYADKFHHGKEEDILFSFLSKKELSDELKGIVSELIEEHRFGRKTAGDLAEAKQKYIHRDKQALPVILDCLRYITDFCPKHIEKEDKHFFYPCMNYFTSEEKETMLKEEWEFDKNLIHHIYKDKISAWNTDSK